MAQVSTRYYISETDIAQLVGLGNFTPQFSQLFTRDYAALKRDVGSTEDRLTTTENEIEVIIVRLDDHDSYLADLDTRLDAAEVTLLGHELRINQAEQDITDLQTDLTDHIADSTTHGATGNIVGTDNYCTAVIGGTVLLAGAVADATSSTVTVTNTATAAGAGYVQATAATWVTLLDELKTDVNQLVTDHNALLAQFNALLASERTAKQLAP